MTDTTLDASEIEQFSALADEWWDPIGKFRPLHLLGPIRLLYLQKQICKHFNLNPKALQSLTNLTVLDIGCGGGLICEPMCRLGADVTGIDPGLETINAARIHAEKQKLNIKYHSKRVEDFINSEEKFDVVLLLEVVEHVPDVTEFVNICAKLIKPGGIMLLSTLNRTLKSYATAIIGAEYILKWLPAGTHNWDRFVTPDELKSALNAANLNVIDQTGMIYNPLKSGGTGNGWFLSDNDLDVNYFMAAELKK